MVAIDRGARADAKASNSFDPIPAGTYNVTVFKADIVDAGKDPYYNDKKAYNVQYRIADGPYENRRLFERVPLFSRWAPSPKYPDGYPAGAFFSFFEALGYDMDVDDFTPPTPAQIGGAPLRVRVRIAWSDYRQENQNEINGHLEAGETQNLADVTGLGYTEITPGIKPDVTAAPASNSPWAIQ